MNNIKTVYIPQNIKEFSSVFSKKSLIMAGSTYSFKSFEKDKELKEIVSISNLPLKYIKKESNNIVIGALSTFDDIENSGLCKKHFFGFLSHASSYCSSQLIRNMATLGGNIAHPNAFNIMPVVMETLNGKLKVFDGKKYKILSLSDYYNERNKVLITEAMIPLKYDKNLFYFEKISRTKTSWESYITFSFRADVKKTKINDIRLVFGSVKAVPLYSPEIEKEMVSRDIKDINVEEISKKYSDLIYSVASSHKYSEYRKEVTYNTVKGFLKKIFGR